MGKIKLNLVSGSSIEKPLLTAFKDSVAEYVVLDNELNGSMGLPIILVCKLNQGKLVKIEDQNEWQNVKESLKKIIATGEAEYINLANELAADDVYYTQLTLPVPSFDALKNSYKVGNTEVQNTSVEPNLNVENNMLNPTPVVENPVVDTPINNPIDVNNSVNGNPEVTVDQVVPNVIPDIPVVDNGIVNNTVNPSLNLNDINTPVIPDVNVELSVPNTPVAPDVSVNEVPSNPVTPEIPVSEGMPATPEIPNFNNIATDQINSINTPVDVQANINGPVVSPSVSVEPGIEQASNPQVTPVTPIAPDAPVVPIVSVEPVAAETPVIDPVININNVTNDVANNMNVNPNVDMFKEQKEAFMTACENMFDALVQKFEKEMQNK